MIASKMLDTVAARLQGLDIGLRVTEEALDLMSEQGYDPVYGARPMRRVIQSLIEDRAAELTLEGALKAGDTALAVAEDNKVILRSEKAPSPEN